MNRATNLDKATLAQACRAIASVDDETLQAIVGLLRDQRPRFLQTLRADLEDRGMSAEDVDACIAALNTLDQTRAALAAAELH